MAATLALSAPAAAQRTLRGTPAEDSRRSRTLFTNEQPPEIAELSVALLMERHLRYKLGGVERLPAVPDEALAAAPGAPGAAPSAAPGAALPAAAYFTVTPSEVLVFERPVARLARGRYAVPAVGGCLPFGATPGTGRPVRCAPVVRERAVAALAEEARRLHARGSSAAPTALLLADRGVPFPTFLATAYAVALATAGAPPRLALAVQSRGRPGAIPFFLLPPRAVTIARGTSPLLLTVRLSGARIRLETAQDSASGGPVALDDLAALERAAGDLKARDPDRTVAFVTADAATSMEQVAAVMARLRLFFPHVVLGESGPVLQRR